MGGSNRGRARRVTRLDVARRAGVSTATVSYVLNKLERVPEKTAARVWKAVEELGYRPNLIARSLATNETKQLAIVLNNIANPIYAELILGFEKEAISRGYFVNICTGNQNVDEYFDNFAARGLDGIFIEVLPYKYQAAKLRELMDTGIKIVLFGSMGPELQSASWIQTDYVDLMEQAVSYLVGLGHERIGYLSGLDRSHHFDLRIEGFERAMGLHSPHVQPVVVAPEENLNTAIRDGAAMARRLLNGQIDVSAIVCTNDLMAIGAMEELNRAGLAVPGDISVVGIDNAYVAELCRPRLTTFASDYRALGARGFRMLYGDIAGGRPSTYLNKAQLVERESTGPPRGA